jgi:hypothetical protein
MQQNSKGAMIGEVRNESRVGVDAFEPVESGMAASPRLGTRGTSPLRWHTDRAVMAVGARELTGD